MINVKKNNWKAINSKVWITLVGGGKPPIFIITLSGQEPSNPINIVNLMRERKSIQWFARLSVVVVSSNIFFTLIGFLSKEWERKHKPFYTVFLMKTHTHNAILAIF